MKTLAGWESWRELNAYAVRVRKALHEYSPETKTLKNQIEVGPLAQVIIPDIIEDKDYQISFIIVAECSLILPAFQEDGPESENKKAITELLADLNQFLKQRCFKILYDHEDYTISGYSLLNKAGQIVKTYDCETGKIITHKPQPTEPRPANLDAELATAEARYIWHQAILAGFVRTDLQWRHSDCKKRAYFAARFAEIIHLRYKWKHFQRLWHTKRMALEYRKLTEVYHTDLTGVYKDVDTFFDTLPPFALNEHTHE